MTNDFDRMISEHLEDRARRASPTPGNVGRVIARGHRRRRQGRTVVAAVAFVAGGSGTGLVIAGQGSSHANRQLRMGGSTSQGAQSATAPSASTPRLVWTASSAGTPSLYMPTVGYVSTLGSGQAVYAVSSGPGEIANQSGPLTSTLYQSADGKTWTVAAAPAGLHVDNLAVDGSQVYAVGTGPANAASGGGSLGGGFQVASRAGTSGAWSTATLPISLGAPAGALNVSDSTSSVAAGPKGTLALVGISASLNLPALLPHASINYWTASRSGVELLGAPDPNACGTGQPATFGGATTSAGNLPATTPAGAAADAAKMAAKLGDVAPSLPPAGSRIDTLDCNGAQGATLIPADKAYTVTASYSWSQLGISPQAAAVVDGQPLAFWSANGKAFQQVQLPAAVSSGDMHVAAGPDGFALTAGATAAAGGGDLLVRSADGTTWNTVPGASAGGTFDGVGYVGGVLTTIRTTSARDVQAVSYRGSVPTVTDLSALAHVTVPDKSGADQASFGPLGVVTDIYTPGGTTVLYSGGGSWSTYDLQALAGTSEQLLLSDAVVGSSDVVLTATPSAAPNGPAQQINIVGTPAG
ncbi:hypothetical protein K6U06_02950 [Acidiferrimicrobium sp. IK]|uniref:hypothetical protein n=1 Tax=Acidiferrimicrobium sp. IK TaxID=2871700 RepID=UPI0021CAEB7F|nr:hypothetical protein [Acidiferrimicrobium sp. IK]MCU4183303.1 hypothetical protein [Acidiferrimicrobium sp. IK]